MLNHSFIYAVLKWRQLFPRAHNVVNEITSFFFLFKSGPLYLSPISLAKCNYSFSNFSAVQRVENTIQRIKVRLISHFRKCYLFLFLFLILLLPCFYVVYFLNFVKETLNTMFFFFYYFLHKILKKNDKNKVTFW